MLLLQVLIQPASIGYFPEPVNVLPEHGDHQQILDHAKDLENNESKTPLGNNIDKPFY
jgi:hypothetical protein